MSQWNQGPDTICPAKSPISTRLQDPVNLRIQENLFVCKPTSIYTLFKRVVDTKPDHRAYAYKAEGTQIWSFVTYKQYWNLCRNAAKSFIKIDLKLNTSVGIIGFNAPEWATSLYGAIFAGGVGCGIYTTNSAEACEYILKDSSSEIVVVENKEQLAKILKCKDTCKIKRIIQYRGEVADSHNGLVISWKEFIDLGNSVSDKELEDRIKTIAPNKCCSLIYTSGTTGNPKAVMLSHDNIIYAARYTERTAGLKQFCERTISFLPLSHIAAQLIDLFICVFTGSTIYYAQPDALRGSLANTLVEVEPTVFFGVPRVWEKMHEKIEKIIVETTGIKKSLINWATKKSNIHINAKFRNESRGAIQYMLAKSLVLSKIHKKLGFSKCRVFVSGAAPISKTTLNFFHTIGIPLCEVFGMSESTGPHVVGLNNQNRVGSVGNTKNIFNLTKIANPDHDDNGEMCLFGRHVFMGYLNSESKTNETIDNEGWLRTGDIGKIDKDNFLFITGRLKELLITAGGENIPPVPIEDAIKEELRQCISNCMLIGDRRKFLTILITLKSQINMDTLEPLDDLTSDCIEWLKSKNSNATKVSQIVANKKDPIYAEIEAGIKRANDKSTSRAMKVQKFSILPKDFSIPSGELGPTLKLRRQIVTAKYADVIESMYKDDKE